MLIPQRQSRLQELLAQRGMSDLDTLAAELRVSASTIRRDLEQLEERGLVSRTHGAVVWTGERAVDSPRPYVFDQRMGVEIEAKRRIAQAAAKLVSPGDTILLDGGTTTFHLAEQLLGRPMQLVTNSLPIANLFLNDDQVELILCGGLMYPRYGVLVGPAAESMLSAIHTKTLFLSVAGINGGILYNQNLLLVQAEQTMMKQAQRIVLLVDAGKFGKQALAKLCELNQIDVVVTDSALSEEHRSHVQAAGCELIIASP